MLQDAAERSDSVDTKITNLKQRVQDQWKLLEKVHGQIVQPDDKKTTITQAEHRIKIAVQRDADERWKNRMDKEGKITTNTIEALRSDLKRLSAKDG